jgi:outer membrane autotransporter protein
VADETADYTSTGVGAVLGMGYDFRLGKSMILAPYVNVLASQGTLRADAAVVDDDYTPTAVQFGLTITLP